MSKTSYQREYRRNKDIKKLEYINIIISPMNKNKNIKIIKKI